MEKNFSKRQRNKEQKKERVLVAAETLFLQNGFENTAIDDVAKEAGLTKRTLYQYFTGKEDLYYAVMLKGVQKLTFEYEQAFVGDKTALEKIRDANRSFYRYYKENAGLYKLMGYQPSGAQNAEQSPHFRELAVYDALRMKHYLNLVEQGQQDGSINRNLDTKKAVFFAFFSAFSLINSVATADDRMWEMLDLNGDDFLKFCLDLLSEAIK